MPATSAKSVGWRQLCAIATELITTDPTIDDSEWKARLKDRLVALGFTYPRPHELTAAMAATQRALEKRWGPRPAPTIPTPNSEPRSEPSPLTKGEIAALLRRLQSSAPNPSTSARVPGWSGLAEILNPPSSAERTPLQQQIDAWRRQQSSTRRHVRTKRGWISYDEPSST